MENYIQRNAESYEKEYANGYGNKYINSTMITYYHNYIKKMLPKESENCVLDLGCGLGTNLRFYEDLGYEIYGIDISSQAIDKAIKLHPQFNKTHFKACNILEYDSLSELFNKDIKINLFVAMESLFYMRDDQLLDCLDIVSKSMVDDGVIYATMRNYNYRGVNNLVNLDNGFFKAKKSGNISDETYINLCKDKEDMALKFEKYFEPVYMFKTCIELHDSVSDELHFIGRKK